MSDKVRDAAQAVVAAYDSAYHVSVPLSDAIDALRAALAEPEWIPVAERLPEHGERAIAFSPTWGISNMLYRWDGGGWIDDDIDIDDVTHWQPLPDPPA